LPPYIYTLAEESSRTGLPIVRPVFLEFPEIFALPSPGFDHLDTEFLLGPSLLVAPQPFPETPDDYLVSFPTGLWYDFWTGLKATIPPAQPSIAEIANAGAGATFAAPPKIHPVLRTLPVYVRAGSILPLQPLIQSTDEIPNGPLELHVYPGQQCGGSLYLDDGHTFGYQRGEFLRQNFTCQTDGGFVRVNFGARHLDEPKREKSKGAIPVIAQLKLFLERHRARSGIPRQGHILQSPQGKPLNLDAFAMDVIRPAFEAVKLP
jgi:alpha-glucosidase